MVLGKAVKLSEPSCPVPVGSNGPHWSPALVGTSSVFYEEDFFFSYVIEQMLTSEALFCLSLADSGDSDDK